MRRTLDEEDVRSLARTTGYVAKRVFDAVAAGRAADRELGVHLRQLGKQHPRDARFIARYIFAAFRCRGWTGDLCNADVPRGLLASYLLDSGPYHVITTDWARRYRDIKGDALTPPPENANLDAPAAWLRAFLREPKARLNPLALVPAWFFKLVAIPNREVEHSLLEAFQRPAPMWIRLRADLPFDGLRFAAHKRVKLAARVTEDIDLYRHAAFKAGAFEIQDLASQAVGVACDPNPGERWWDACAGAGGKTLQLASVMNPKGVVVATDIKEHKLAETRRRAARAKLHNVTTKAWDGKKPPARNFDGVLVDAPCSGIGTWRRNPDARWRTSPDDIRELAVLQRSILDAVAGGVRPGGRLVYAVCTLSTAETVDVVDAFLARHSEFALAPAPHPLTGEPIDGRAWIWPHTANCDGMFIARFVRSK